MQLFELDGARIGARTTVAGTPAEFWVKANPSAYADLAQRHRRGVRLVSTP